MNDITDYDRQGNRITCRHEWHYLADGLPTCRMDKEDRPCQGQTIGCGQGSIECERHADRRAPKPAPKPAPRSSYTVTIGIEELTMLTLAAEDRARDLRDRAKTAREFAYAYVNIEQLDESATEYEQLVAKLRRTPQNSPALSELLAAGEADRAPIGGDAYAVTLNLGLHNRPTFTLAGPHEAAQLATTLNCDGWDAYVSENVAEWCDREGFLNPHAIRPVSDLTR